jgi:NADPH:quinone reductase
LKKFPAGIGKEAAGIIVGLPSDPKVLDHPSYKERGYKLGGKVALVTILTFLL